MVNTTFPQSEEAAVKYAKKTKGYDKMQQEEDDEEERYGYPNQI
jgi:hypothetical protein